MKRSFYEMLGVPHDADQGTIDVANAQATQRLNTNIKNGAADATTEAQLVREGYQILSDPEKRARYDAKLSAAETGVQLMFFPEGKHAQRKLGVQSVIFAVLASTFCGVVYWQMTRKMVEVRVDYETVVARKQVDQNAPKVIEALPPELESPTIIVDAARSEPLIKDIAAR